MNWFLTALILSSSFSVRTPKVGSETDWQFLLSAERPSHYSIMLEEEQEAGIRYTNQRYAIRYNWEDFFTRDSYVALDSRGIFYNQAEINYKSGGWYGGYALRHTKGLPSHRIVGGYEIDKLFAGIYRLNFTFGANTDLDIFDYTLNTKFSIALFKFFQAYNLVIFEQAGGKIYRQVKLGISMELPNGTDT